MQRRSERDSDPGKFRRRGIWFFAEGGLRQKKCRESENDHKRKRMSGCTMPTQIGGGPETGAERVHVRDRSCSDNHQNAAPRSSRKKTALHRERSQTVC